MAWTVFAAATSGKGRLLQYQHFHSIKFELRVQAVLIQLWKWKRAADRKTWEMTDVFSRAVKYLPETHLHTIKIKTFLVLISSGVSLTPLSKPELSYRRRLCSVASARPRFFFQWAPVYLQEECAPQTVRKGTCIMLGHQPECLDPNRQALAISHGTKSLLWIWKNTTGLTDPQE